jgi:hypothetical protein
VKGRIRIFTVKREQDQAEKVLGRVKEVHLFVASGTQFGFDLAIRRNYFAEF